MTRAHIADAELVAKTLAGREAEVRPCIACNQGCVGGLARGRLGCTVNPVAGRELESRGRPAGTAAASDGPRTVLVVGGGPAGLEAARVAHDLGARVVLVEADDVLGGALRCARRAPYHAPIGDVADWLEREVRRRPIELLTGRTGDVALARDCGAERVILACGARPPARIEQRFRPGWPTVDRDGPAIVGARALLAATPPEGVRRAIVLDDLGTYEGIAAAEWLVEHGAEVVHVTGDRAFAPRLEAALVPGPALERLRRGRFVLHARAALRHVGRGGGTVAWLEGGEPWFEPADLVVTALAGEPADALLGEFASAGLVATAVGDARHPGTLEAAIGAAYAAAREAVLSG